MMKNRQIPPDRELVYYPCFDGFQCARLDLPMDWNQTGRDGYRIQLAVARLPAKVPVTDVRYGGLLWLQDGGPGESGIDFILSLGKSFQMIVDSDQDPSEVPENASTPAKYFDIMAIDSRGLNNSTPCFSCFPSTASRETWLLESAAEGVLGSSDVAFQDLWTRASTVGTGCSHKVLKSKSHRDRLAVHVNTTPQIADMVAILELHGQWREKEAARLLEENGTPLAAEKILEIVERTRGKGNEEKLNFWGFSYGTVIGASFAAMQPHRVQRLVIDGVVDTPDYFTGHRLTALQDTDTIPERLSRYCHEAGPERCSLYEEDGAWAIMQTLHRTIESLKSNPIGVPATGTIGPQIVTYSDVIRALFGSLYAPIQSFPSLAQCLVDLSNGNGTSFAATKDLRQRRQDATLPRNTHDSLPYSSQECHTQRSLPGDTRTAILCTDSNDTFGMTGPAFESYIRTLHYQSPMFAELFAQVRMGCIAWSAKPKWRFAGPYSGKTAYPMLMVGTLADPVTPIRNAHTLAGRFEGSKVLAVDGEGHCSLSSPSICAARYIRKYFQQGQLPGTGSVCDANEKTFLGLVSSGADEDARLLEELRFVARHWS